MTIKELAEILHKIVSIHAPCDMKDCLNAASWSVSTIAGHRVPLCDAHLAELQKEFDN